MAAIEVGTAYVSIVPSARGFGVKLQEELAGPIAGVGAAAGTQIASGAQSGLARSAPGLAAAGRDVGARAGEGVKVGLVDRLAGAGPRLTQAGQALTVGLTAPLAGLGIAAFRASVDFESAFAGVRKTVDATAPQLERIRTGIIAMANEIPASREEIAAVAEAAGQLGVAAPNILGFTRVMIDLGNTTNLSAEEAANSLARLANITQLPQSEFDRLGATIVDLGNRLATTESELTEMGLRIAGAGHQIGLSEAQILGFAGALSSVGIEAEAGGSSISRTFIRIEEAVRNGGDELEQFARVAGVSAADFKAAYQKDAAGAIVTFIEGLGRMSKEGGNVFAVLDDLGLSEIRVRDALLRAAGAGDLFRKSLKIGTRAWRENTALTAEAGKRYETTESKLKILSNRFGDAALKLGDALVPALLDLVEAGEPVIDIIGGAARLFSRLPKPVQTAAAGLGLFAGALGPVAFGLGTIAPGLKVLKDAKVIEGIAGIGKGLKGLAGIVAANPQLVALGGVVALGAFVIAHEDEIRGFAAENFTPQTDEAQKAVTQAFANAGETWKQAQEDYFRIVTDPTASQEAKAQAEANLGRARDAFIRSQREIIRANEKIQRENESFLKAPLLNTFKGAIRSGTDALGITEFFQGVNDDVTGFFSDVSDTISGWQPPDVLGTLEGWWAPVGGFFTGTIPGFLRESWNRVTTDTTNAVGTVTGIIEGLGSDFGRVLGGIRDTAIEIGSTIAGAVKGIINTVIDGVNWVIRKLKGFQVPSVSIGPFHLGGQKPFGGLSEIPKLAKGGLVMGPTLALIGEAGPELVIPLDSIGKGLAGLDLPPLELTARIRPELTTEQLPSLTVPAIDLQGLPQLRTIENRLLAQWRPADVSPVTVDVPQAGADGGVTVHLHIGAIHTTGTAEDLERQMLGIIPKISRELQAVRDREKLRAGRRGARG